MAQQNPTTESGPFNAQSLIVEAELRIEREALRAYLKEQGIKCLDCPAAEIETFADGAHVHGFDLDRHIAALNQLARECPTLGVPGYAGPFTSLGRWIMNKLKDREST